MTLNTVMERRASIIIGMAKENIITIGRAADT
jgi:hypothetical protein